jgi:hypothetical protein
MTCDMTGRKHVTLQSQSNLYGSTQIGPNPKHNSPLALHSRSGNTKFALKYDDPSDEHVTKIRCVDEGIHTCVSEPFLDIDFCNYCML